MTRLLLIILLLVSFEGCAAKNQSPYSGFLGDQAFYSKLSKHPELEGVKVFRKNEHPLAEYDSFILPPVKIYLSEVGRSRDVTPEELNELAQFFRNSVYEALRDRYRITNVPGPGVAILRLAITDADPNLALMNVHPGSLLIGGGLGGASVEAELVDSTSGEQVAAAIASSKGKRYEYTSGLTRWGHTHALLSDWAKVIRKRVDEDHGYLGLAGG